MADVKKTIEIIFGAVDNTGQGLSSVAKGIGDFSDNVSKVTGPLSDIGDFALKAEAAIVGLGVALIGFSVNEASKFQAAQNEIGTLLGASTEQANEFGRGILNYASTSTQAIDQITAATYSAISAGAAQADALSVVNNAEKLAVAGKAELNATTVALVSTLNAYGASADDAARYSDVLFTTVKLGQTTIPELAASLAQVTGIAGSAGVPIETLGAAIAALTASGLPTAQSITGIKAAISGIIQPSSSAAEAAKTLGINFNAAALESKGFEGVMQDIAQATGGNVEKIASLFGSVEALNVVLSLTADDGARFNTALEAMQSAAGATDAAFKLMSSNAALSFQNLQNNLKISLITAGLPILEQFGGSIAGLSDVFKSLTFSIDKGAFDPLYAALGEAAKGLETFLNGIAKALPDALKGVDFTGLAKSFGDIGKAAGGIFGELDLTKPEDLERAIQFVVDSVESLNKVVEGIVTAWGPALQTMVEAVAKFNGLSEGAKTATGETLGFAQVFEKVLSPIIGGVTGAVEGLGDAMTLLAGVMGAQLAATTIPKLAFSFGTLLGVLGQAGLVGAAGAAGYAVGTVLNDPINKLVSSLSGSEQTLGTWIYELANGKREAELLGLGASGAASGVTALGDATNAAQGGAAAMARESAELAKGLDGVAGAVSKVTSGPFVDYIDAMGNVVKRTTESGEGLDEWNKKLLASGGVVEESAGGMVGLAAASKAAGAETQKIIPIFDAATGKIIGYEQNLAAIDTTSKEVTKSQDSTATAVAKTAEEIKDAEEKTRAWNLEMAKLDSAESIALIAAQTSIATARIEADAQKMVAAFDSVAASVTSTGETLSSLYGTLGSGNLNRSQELALENELRKESQRRDDALRLQKTLTEAQIREINARAKQLERGDAVIQIDGAGLEPELEAFMWRILSRIRIRANAEFQDYLLGVNGT